MKPNKFWILYGLIFIILIVAAAFGYAFWVHVNHYSSLGNYGLEQAGQIGDSFGLINALFTLLSMILVSAALVLQTNELSLQRKDMKESRTDIKKQAEATQKLAEAQEQTNELEWQKQYLTISSEVSVLEGIINAFNTDNVDSLVDFQRLEENRATLEKKKVLLANVVELGYKYGYDPA